MYELVEACRFMRLPVRTIVYNVSLKAFLISTLCSYSGLRERASDRWNDHCYLLGIRTNCLVDRESI